ncbi:amidohydrolase family protein [Halalkaliarchaeum desulfuricum]|nr:amidohydrolase family protein [Halalkaliarchaeum desulfuricum]
MDTLIENALLVTMDPESRGATGELGIVEDGAVGIADGQIEYVGPAADVDEAIARPRAGAVVDAEGDLACPGLVNAHAHTRHTIVRGAAQDLPEIEWMNRGLGPISAHATREDGVIGAKLGVLEALASGTTTVCEYARRVGELVEEVYEPFSVRCVATETINEVPDDRADLGPEELYPFDRGNGEAGLERAEALFDEYEDETASLVEPAYGPQALDMVSLRLLEEIERRADEHGRRIHIHVAQGEREAIQIRERYGEDGPNPIPGAGEEPTTVSVLDAADLLSDRLIAAHLHGATPDERARLADAGVSMVGCPSSIAAIDGIVPPIVEYREHGGTVGIGTDQAPGPGGHNAVRELRTAALLSKTDRGDPTAMPAWETLEVATVGGARALGIDDVVGTLTEGKRADVAVFDFESPWTAPTVDEPFHTAIPNLVYGGTGVEATDVFVDGRRLLRDGEVAIEGFDAGELIAEANRRAERIFSNAEEDWRDAGSKLVTDVDAGRL